MKFTFKFKICFIVLMCIFAIAVYAATLPIDHENPYYAAGQYYKNAQEDMENSSTHNQTVLAKYNGIEITSSMVAYQKSMNLLRTEDAAGNNDTTEEIVNNIIIGHILLEEAERLGLSATEKEIDALIKNAIQAYSIPEGKKMMDDFCAGAGITFEEYLEAYREQLPRSIARQKLLDAVAKQYCEENGLEFTKVNPPEEIIAAKEAYIEELFNKKRDSIEYFININELS